MIEVYENIAGQLAPVRGIPIDQKRDVNARVQVALQSGHGEHRTSVSYVGGKPRGTVQETQP